MMRKRIWIAASVVAVFGSMAVLASAGPEGEYDEQAMMEAWMKAGQTGPQHEGLANMVGEWKTVTTHYENGAAAGEPSEGTAEFVSMLGGRVIRGMHKGMMMGQPFQGMSMDGFDNVTEEYWSLWLDSMSTGVYVSRGEMVSENAFEYHGTMPSPMGGEVKMRYVNTFAENEGKMDMYMTAPGQDEEVLSMVMTYTRIGS